MAVLRILALIISSLECQRGRASWALLGAASLSLMSCAAEEEAPTPTVVVTQGPLVYKASFHGELEAVERQAIHAPELPGVDFLTVDTVLDDGTRVKEGDVVLNFVRGPLEDELRAVETDLAVVEAELKRTGYNLDQERVQLQLDVRRREMELERARLFVVEGVNLISKLELDKYKLDVSKAEIELELARKAMRAFAQKRATTLEIQRLKVEAKRRDVDEKRQNLALMGVKAPADGMLYGPYTRLNWVRGKVAPGSVCRPGDKLLEIPDLSRFQVVVYVRQRDANLLKVGDEAEVRPTANPSRAISARLTVKDDVATTRNERLGTELPENNLKEIRIVFEMTEAPEFLRPSGTAQVNVALTLSSDSAIIPLAALHKLNDAQAASSKGGAGQGRGASKPGAPSEASSESPQGSADVVESRQAKVVLEGGEEVEVTIGRASTSHAELLGGLEVGQRVELGH